MDEKRCSTCKQMKSLEDFSKHRGRKSGYRYDCKACAKIAVAQYRIDNADKLRDVRKRHYQKDLVASRLRVRESQVRMKFGLTLSQIEQITKDQGGCCKMCGGLMEARGQGKFSAVVDHDHRTGRIRGVIHSNCNCLLGFAQDSLSLLRNAITYLEDANAV